MAGPSDPNSAVPHSGAPERGVGPVVDPTKNVLDLVEAANKRQDDLRAADDRRLTAEIASARDSGLPLPAYVEKRFTLFEREIDQLRSSVDRAFTETDLRYQQRFDAQAKALEAAFQAAKEAVQAALSAADRAVSKAELASDKRFEALNELRQMLNDTLKGLMTRGEVEKGLDTLTEKINAAGARMNGLETRINVAAGETTGSHRTKDDTKGYIAVGISALCALLLLATFIFARFSQASAPDLELAALRAEIADLKKPATAPQVIYVPAPTGTQLPVTPPASVPR